MTALLKQKRKYECNSARRSGWWLLTKGSTLYWQENDLPFEQQGTGLTTQKAMLSGNGNHNLYGLWQKMIKMNEVTFLTEFVVITDWDFHLLYWGVRKSIIFENPPILRKVRSKRNKLTMSLRFNAQVVAIVLTPLFAFDCVAVRRSWDFV